MNQSVLVQRYTHFCIYLSAQSGMNCDSSNFLFHLALKKDIPQIYWMWVLSVHIRNYKVLLVDGGCQCVNTGELGFVTYMCSEKKYLLSLYYVPSPCLTRKFQNIPHWHCTWLHGVYGLAETTDTMLLQRQPVTNMINTKEIWGLM